MKTFAFTGHRPEKLGGYSTSNNPIYDKVKDWLEFTVELLVRRHVDVRFISGGALGIDQMAAEAVLKIRNKYQTGHLLTKIVDGEELRVVPTIELIFILPCHEFDSKWPQHAQAHFQKLLWSADEFTYVYEGTYPGPWVLQARNEAMVNASDGIIAVYDGSTGGTRNCMLYAWKKRVPILQLDIKKWTEIRHVKDPKKV